METEATEKRNQKEEIVSDREGEDRHSTIANKGKDVKERKRATGLTALSRSKRERRVPDKFKDYKL